MAGFNKVILLGNLTKDPELRYTPSGASVCSFDIAVNRSYSNQAGERKEEVCYVTIVTWGKQAETCSQYLHKGRPVLVEGRLTQRSWETPEGQRRSKHEVVAERVQFLGKGKDQAATPDAEGSSLEGDDSVPF
jgi:single-strand DNA-binding protein